MTGSDREARTWREALRSGETCHEQIDMVFGHGRVWGSSFSTAPLGGGEGLLRRRLDIILIATMESSLRGNELVFSLTSLTSPQKNALEKFSESKK